jgi:hypothetical protein
MQTKLFALKCEEEQTVLSSRMEASAWHAIEKLAGRLSGDLSESDRTSLSSWKSQDHMALAKEIYFWRRAIDLIKDTDLSSIIWQPSEDEMKGLMKSKPVMLKIAGEITNALMHSHQNRHRVSFFQIESVEPSGFAT